MKTTKRPRGASGKNSKIFISYRRDDARGHAVHLHSDLTRHFGAERIFMDTSGIEGGQDFGRVIEARLADCEVLIAVIGRRWLSLFDNAGRPQTGKQPGKQSGKTDWVLLELATALNQRIAIVPVLVDDANVPNERDLPTALEGFARLQAVRMRDDQWDQDLARLIGIIEHSVPEKKPWLLVGLMALSLLAALLVYFQIVRTPLPVKLDPKSQTSFPILGDELTIKDPVVSSNLLLSRDAAPDEDLQVTLGNVQLLPATVADFELDALSASSLQKLSYSSYSGADYDPAGGQCKTTIRVNLREGGKQIAEKQIAELRFQNTDAALGGDYRALQLESVGAELLVQLSSDLVGNPKLGTEFNGPGCGKRLEGAFGHREKYGPYTLDAVVPAAAPVVFVFRPTNKPLWEKDDSYFQPFRLGSQNDPQDTSLGLTASAVSVKPRGHANTFEVRSVDGKSSLQIESLEVGPQKLLVNISGEGFVKQNGADAVGTIDRLKRQPRKAALLLVTTTAFLVCLLLLLRRLYLA
jgi:hypothetical protein